MARKKMKEAYDYTIEMWKATLEALKEQPLDKVDRINLELGGFMGPRVSIHYREDSDDPESSEQS